MDESSRPKRTNPSRSVCEQSIHRILITEVLENGANRHFKNATDFMSYFESLYPAGPSLTKQVQRAVRAMNMPKDENGYFIVDKTQDQKKRDDEISEFFQRTNAAVLDPDDSLSTVFLSCDASYRQTLLQMISESPSFAGKYLTMLDSSDGIVFLTDTASKPSLLSTIRSLLSEDGMRQE